MARARGNSRSRNRSRNRKATRPTVARPKRNPKSGTRSLPGARMALAALSTADDTHARLVELRDQLSDALGELEDARDTAEKLSDRQKAESRTPEVERAPRLVESKISALDAGSSASGIKAPSQTAIDKTAEFARKLGEVDAQTEQVRGLASLATQLVNLADSL